MRRSGSPFLTSLNIIPKYLALNTDLRSKKSDVENLLSETRKKYQEGQLEKNSNFLALERNLREMEALEGKLGKFEMFQYKYVDGLSVQSAVYSLFMLLYISFCQANIPIRTQSMVVDFILITSFASLLITIVFMFLEKRATKEFVCNGAHHKEDNLGSSTEIIILVSFSLFTLLCILCIVLSICFRESIDPHQPFIRDNPLLILILLFTPIIHYLIYYLKNYYRFRKIFIKQLYKPGQLVVEEAERSYDGLVNFNRGWLEAVKTMTEQPKDKDQVSTTDLQQTPKQKITNSKALTNKVDQPAKNTDSTKVVLNKNRTGLLKKIKKRKKKRKKK